MSRNVPPTSLSVPNVPPGEFLVGLLRHHRVTQRSFAAALGVSEKHLSDLVNGDVRVTPAMAVILEAATGVGATLWGAMDLQHRTRELRRRPDTQTVIRRVRRDVTRLSVGLATVGRTGTS